MLRARNGLVIFENQMACSLSLKSGPNISGPNRVLVRVSNSGYCCSFSYVESKLKADRNCSRVFRLTAPSNFSVRGEASICVSRGRRWWEKTLKPNMIEINSAQELVDSLLNAGDNLVIVDFYSPSCGACKALHPKFAESNPDAIFLKVNYEQLRTMCQSLNVHVLPFFRMYRGAEGRVCSFSCTNATVKKFRDALAKYGRDRCSVGPARGLEEAERISLGRNGEISPCRNEERFEDEIVMPNIGVSGFLGQKR